MIYTVDSFWANKKKYVSLASIFFVFMSDRFAMLHIFYEQLRSGDITSCLRLWVTFYLKDCLVLVVSVSSF